MKVWKFAVPIPNSTGRSFIDLPTIAEPLSVGLQDDIPFLWALVDPGAEASDEQPTGPRRLIVANTGQEVPGFPEGARFLGTVTTSNGNVWHVWDGDADANGTTAV